jgi:AhpD family alkylhydroperoxidase
MRIDYAKVAPDAVKALAGVRPYLSSTAIEPKLRALIELRVSQINGCSYCVDMHSQDARKRGETEQRLDCLPVWRETKFYTDRERAALAWAESVTLVSETGIPDSVFEEVRKQFSERDLVDLTFVIATMNAWNRIAIGFRQGPSPRTDTPTG